MQITKCYIQNFGKLQNCELEFNKNLNSIIKENGWGKSTLATFIKAMLFGLNSTTKRDLDENERQKYASWGKESFGGYIDFELNNHSYRLERKFGLKANQDTATLYDLNTNKICTDYSANIMEEYFGINNETFERTTYIAQGHISTEINDGIRAKLGNLLQNEQQNNFNATIQNITEMRKQKQLYRGKGGEIDDIRQKIDDANRKLAYALQQKEQLSVLQIKYNQEITEIEKKQTQLKQLDAQLSALDKQQVQNAELERCDELQQNLQNLKNQYESLIQFFHNQIPTPQILNQVQSDINIFNAKQIQLSANSQTTNQELDNLQRFFAKNVPTNEQLDEMMQLEQRAQSLQQTSTISAIERTTNIAHNYALLYSLISILFVALGIGICVFANYIIGAIVGGIGIVGLVISLIAFFVIKNKNKNQQSLQKQNQQKQRQQYLANELSTINKTLFNFVSQFMTPSQYIQHDLTTIKINLTQYEYLKKNNQFSKEKTDSINNELTTLKSNLNRFFAIYFDDFSQNYQNLINTMHQKLCEYQNTIKDIEIATSSLQQYIKKTGVDPTKKVTPIELQKSAVLNEQKLQLQNELNECTHTHGQTTATINNLAKEVDNLDVYQNELQLYKNEEQKILHEIDVLDNIKKYLEKANDNLNSKYISPMTTRFNYYLNLLSSTPPNISLNSDMDISIEEQGAKRDKKHLSVGYRDILNLCMRFALVDAIFKDEQPPIVLDDPFVNLDETNTKNALSLISKIANDKQIIYLACHSSRTNK